MPTFAITTLYNFINTKKLTWLHAYNNDMAGDATVTFVQKG